MLKSGFWPQKRGCTLYPSAHYTPSNTVLEHPTAFLGVSTSVDKYCPVHDSKNLHSLYTYLLEKEDVTMKPGVDSVDLRLFSDLSAVLQAWDLESLMTAEYLDLRKVLVSRTGTAT